MPSPPRIRGWGRITSGPRASPGRCTRTSASFAGYINDYDLHRQEGVLLRHLSSVYKVLAQTVPPAFKTEAVQEMEDWLAGVLRGTDSSLLDEWERLRDPNYRPTEDAPDAAWRHRKKRTSRATGASSPR